MSTVNLDDGEGYISYDGVAYINVKEKQDCNLCIKAFSDNRWYVQKYSKDNNSIFRYACTYRAGHAWKASGYKWEVWYGKSTGG